MLEGCGGEGRSASSPVHSVLADAVAVVAVVVVVVSVSAGVVLVVVVVCSTFAACSSFAVCSTCTSAFGMLLAMSCTSKPAFHMPFAVFPTCKTAFPTTTSVILTSTTSTTTKGLENQANLMALHDYPGFRWNGLSKSPLHLHLQCTSIAGSTEKKHSWTGILRNFESICGIHTLNFGSENVFKLKTT